MKKLLLIMVGVYFHISSLYAQSITELAFFSPLISTFEMKYTSDHLIISQQGLKIFDISNPLNPVQSGQASYPGSYAYQLAISGTNAYMALGGSGYFSVYDITNFNSPALLGSIVIPSTSFVTGGDLIVHNSTAYITAVDSMYVVDVSIPTSPAFVQSLQVINLPPFGSASSLSIIDTTLFVLNSLNISLYNIADPLNPVFVNSIPLSHPLHNGLTADTAGKRLFVPWLTALQQFIGHDAYDVTDPLAPQLLFSDSIAFTGGEFGVTDYYNNLLAISESGGLHLFDVSSGTHGYLTSFSGQNVPNSSVSIEFRDSVFINARRGGFEILKYTGSFPTMVQQYNNEFSIFIYPNPVTMESVLEYRLTRPSEITIQLEDLSGKIIKSINTSLKDTGQHFYPLTFTNELSAGIYILRMISRERAITHKMVIQ
jgi:hypothetical protein